MSNWLVVIAIISLLIALLLPAVQSARNAAKRIECTNRLKQIGLAMHNYMAVHQVFPMGNTAPSRHGMFSAMLPYLEQQAVYDRLNFKGDPQNEAAKYNLVPIYACPSYPYRTVVRNNPTTYMNGALTHFQGVAGSTLNAQYPRTTSFGSLPQNGMFRWAEAVRLTDVVDGTSNTLAIGEWVHRDFKGGAYSEPPGNVRGWIMGANSTDGSYSIKAVQYPLNVRIDRVADGVAYHHLPFGSYHGGGALFVSGDGSVRFIVDRINLQTLKSLATANGRENEQMPN